MTIGHGRLAIRGTGGRPAGAPRGTPGRSRVSEIYQSFERDLVRWQKRYAARPDHEMLRLCLLSLEREQNVVVAYDKNTLGRRLASMPLADNVRELIRHALAWVWREEETHALYMRHTLLKVGDPLLSVRTHLQYLAGAIGGWTVSVQQHRRWTEAPLSRGTAILLTWAGALTGRVPPAVRRHLVYSSFRDFCRYNMDAERTAWLCWQRMAELAPHVSVFFDGEVDAFHRVAHEEERHRQVFGTLADVLTDDDWLRESETWQSLSARLAAVGECFVPGSKRLSGGRGTPLCPHPRSEAG